MPAASKRLGSGFGAALAVVVLACATPATGASSSCPGSELRPTTANARAVAVATLCLVNRVRAGFGLRTLHANAELRHVASSQVTSMVHEDYFGDDRPTGQTPLSLVTRTRYPAHSARLTIGQNIAWGTGLLSTPAQIVAQWMASPAHREIMLDGSYRDAGVAVTPAVPAVLHAPGYGATYAMEFGARAAR